MLLLAMPPRVTRAASRRSDTRAAVANGIVSPGRKKREREEAGSSPPFVSKRPREAAIDSGKAISVSPVSEAGVSEEPVIPIKVEKDVVEEKVKATVQKTRKRKTKGKEEQAEDMKPLAPRTEGLRMFIGAHVSASKGIHNAVTNSLHIGGNAFALFLKSQRKWDNPPMQDDHRDQFRTLCSEHKYDASKYVLPHGSYLVNLAQEDPTKANQAYNSFIDDLRRCEELGIKLYNFHPGASNQSTLESALSRLAKALIAALDATKTVIPVLETTCGHGTSIGGPLSHFKSLLALIPESYHSRLGICLDTCHTFAAGYDLRTQDTWNAFMKEFDETVGLKFLRALHINDSKTPLGSNRDLHANIGTGFLGLRAFHNVMNDKRLEGLPMILETPIDRPAESVKAEQKEEALASECAHDELDVSEAESPSKKRTKASTSSKVKKIRTTKAKTKTKPAMIEDKSVWVREIKLLESLIGMDPESEKFKSLEAELSEQGREEREKQQALYDKKKEKEKAKEEKQKDIRVMFGSTKKKGSKAKTAGKRGRKGGRAESSDEESALSSENDEST
ncbi:apurinic endonuclease (APN1) [Coccidioides immitis RS]|uniref:Apurinic-apyrimidinic endonuclease 1 n=3 Tax=Coccidioides immitis TaxID=5501 RepID=J3KIJ5_COCIM|nr:apurinic endonuclease (APN1) [Coccidioides immitis RS]EAS35795.3 apurinic endonuclease (APN1) [Coccidioides immitis RS]